MIIKIKIMDLYNKYQNGLLNRRNFLKKLSLLVGGSASAITLLPLIEKDYVKETINNLPAQFKLLLFSISKKEIKNKKDGMRNGITTGEAYTIYKETCKEVCFKSLTQRRISDIISELDTLGILITRVVSLGRHGKTKEILLSVSPEELISFLQEDDLIGGLSGFKIKDQARLF